MDQTYTQLLPAGRPQRLGGTVGVLYVVLGYVLISYNRTIKETFANNPLVFIFGPPTNLALF